MHRHDGDGQERRADHRERLREGERAEEFPLLAQQREHRHERQDDDEHGEEDRAAHLLRGLPWLNNDWVNTFCTLSGAAAAGLAALALLP